MKSKIRSDKVFLDAMALALIALTYSLCLDSQFKTPAPHVMPRGREFVLQLKVRLTISNPETSIFYRYDTTGDFRLYHGGMLTVDGRNNVIQAYAARDGWKNSDTITEIYTLLPGSNSLGLAKPDGALLGGTGMLTGRDTAFVISFVTSDSLVGVENVTVTTGSGDSLRFNLNEFQMEGALRVFEETLDLMPGVANPSNTAIEVALFDTMTVKWVEPAFGNDTLMVDVPIFPAPMKASIHLSDSLGQIIAEPLEGGEATLYFTVQDQPFHPGSMYTVEVNLTKNARNSGEPESERFLIVPLAGKPGKGLATVPIAMSSPGGVVEGNGILEIQAGDIIRAIFKDPVYGETAVHQVTYPFPLPTHSPPAFATKAVKAPFPGQCFIFDVAGRRIRFIHSSEGLTEFRSQEYSPSLREIHRSARMGLASGVRMGIRNRIMIMKEIRNQKGSQKKDYD